MGIWFSKRGRRLRYILREGQAAVMPGDTKFDTSSPLQKRPNDKKLNHENWCMKIGDVGLGSIELCALCHVPHPQQNIAFEIHNFNRH